VIFRHLDPGQRVCKDGIVVTVATDHLVVAVCLHTVLK
jgi:hypothetical protein